MKIKKSRKKLPFNILMGTCYLLLVLYAYIKVDRIINDVVVLTTCVALIDCVYFFIMLRKVEIRLQANEIIQKNEDFKVNIVLRNKSLLPTTYIYLVPKEGIRMELKSKDSIGVLLKGKESVSYSILYNAKLCGHEEIGLEKIVYKSYFSFFRKEIDIADKAKIKILPSIEPLGEMKSFTEFISSQLIQKDKRLEVISGNDNSEEEIGYELRPYVEGDSERLIHWKIAAYKEELLVRQRQKGNERKKEIFFILNPFLDRMKEEQIVTQDKLVTSFASLVGFYLEQGEKVQIAYYQSGSWQHAQIDENFSLTQLQEILSDYDFLNVEEVMNQRSILKRIIHMAKKKSGIKVVVSNYWTYEMEEYILSRKQVGIIPYIWTGSEVPKELVEQSDMPIWHMTDNYKMYLPLEIPFSMVEENK